MEAPPHQPSSLPARGLLIADLFLDFRGPVAFEFEAVPLYAPFAVPADSPAPGCTTVPVGLRADETPDVAAMRTVFDAQAWAAFEAADGARYLAHPAPDGRAVFWAVRVDSGGRGFEVFCSSHYVRERNGRPVIRGLLQYPVDQLVMMYALGCRDGAIVHAAGVTFGGRGVLLPGRSRAGKSTVSRMLTSAPGGDVLSDDRIVVRRAGGEVTMFGTPWPGEAGIARNVGVPLAAVVFLRKATETALVRLTPTEAAERLLPVTSIPWYEDDLVRRILAHIDAVTASVPAYDLHFTLTSPVADVLRDVV